MAHTCLCACEAMNTSTTPTKTPNVRPLAGVLYPAYIRRHGGRGVWLWSGHHHRPGIRRHPGGLVRWQGGGPAELVRVVRVRTPAVHSRCRLRYPSCPSGVSIPSLCMCLAYTMNCSRVIVSLLEGVACRVPGSSRSIDVRVCPTYIVVLAGGYVSWPSHYSLQSCATPNWTRCW